MDDHERGGLSEVIAQYVKAAMPIATQNVRQGELIAWPAGRWTSESGGHYRREQTIRVSWDPAIRHRQERLRGLPEYQAVVAFITSKPEWARQFDNLVGTSMTRMRLDMAQFIDGCLDDALAAQAEAGSDPVGAAAERASTIELFLDSTDVEIVTFAPLLGMTSFGLGTMRVADDLSLEPMGEAELERLFSVGLLAPVFPNQPFFSPPSHTVRFTYRTRKQTGDMPASQDPATLDDPGRASEQALEDLVACLRVYRGGSIAIAGSATAMPSPFGGFQYRGTAGHHLFGGRMIPMFPSAYALAESDEPSLKTLWEQMHTKGFQRSRQLALATRRFSYRGERTRVDDQLVDLIVAAEALFLGGSDDESRGELRYRLSSRAAWYGEGSGRSRLSIFKLFMAAYRMRSRLVHGTDAKAITVAREELTPERMVDVIEGLLRFALRKAIEEAANGTQAWEVDWERLLFPETAGSCPR